MNNDLALEKSKLASRWGNLVYIKEIRAGDMPDELVRQLGLPPDAIIYAIHDSDGAPLALTSSRAEALAGARQNALKPVSIH